MPSNARAPRERPKRAVHRAFGRLHQERGVSWYVGPMLAIVRWLGPLYVVLGVDKTSLVELLRVKLTLNDRRQRREGEGGPLGNLGFGLMLVMYALLGALIGWGAFAVEDPDLYITGISSLALVLVSMPLLADFSTILLDTSDIEILAPLPISDRTVVAVRVTHLCLYVVLLIAAIGIGPCLCGAVAFDALHYLPVFALSLLQVGLLSTGSVVVLYLLALKSFDLSRFRDALVYLQSGSFVLFYVGTQAAPRLFMTEGVSEFLQANPALILALPTSAGGALWRLVSGGGESLDPWGVILGWTLTLGLSGWAVYLARGGIVTQLAQLESAGGVARKRPRRYGITGRLAARLTADPLERGGWSFFVSMCSADRLFKMRTMPMTVIAILPLIMVFVSDGEEGLQDLRGLLAYLPYMLLFVMPGVWQASRFAETYQGRWVFDDLMPEQRARFTRGALRAAFLRFHGLPLGFLLIVAAFCVELEAWLSLFLAAGVVLAASSLLLPRFGSEVPFTRKFSQSMAGSNLGLALLAALGAGVLSFAHYVVFTYVPHAAWLGVLALPLGIWAWRRVGRVDLQAFDRRR